MDESGGGAPYKAGEWVRQRLRWLVKLGRYEGEGGHIHHFSAVNFSSRGASSFEYISFAEEGTGGVKNI